MMACFSISEKGKNDDYFFCCFNDLFEIKNI